MDSVCDLFRVYVDKNFNFQFLLSPWIVIFGLVVVLIYLRVSRIFSLKACEIDEAELGIGSAKIKIRPNHENLQIAYQLWVELNTRKIGLPIDVDHDVIEEIYNSWYEFFKVTRELIKSIPARHVRSDANTRKLVCVATEVLNEGVRPHLTRQQARYRRWYEAELQSPKNAELSPQEIQARYPKFKELCEDMLKVNKSLIHYRDKLNEIVMGKA